LTLEWHDTSMYANRLVGVTLWRVFVAAVGWYGFDQVTDASRLLPWALPPWWMLGELSQLASLLVVVCYLALAAYPLLVGGARHERSTGSGSSGHSSRTASPPEHYPL